MLNNNVQALSFLVKIYKQKTLRTNPVLKTLINKQYLHPATTKNKYVAVTTLLDRTYQTIRPTNQEKFTTTI